MDELERALPGDGVVYACDFYVTGADAWTAEPGGLRSGRILNVDHHSRRGRMDAPVTSTRLAVDHVRSAGIAEPGSLVVINHTDCDSVLSSGIMLGLLPPLDDFVAASVVADHTGTENDIADLLQALDEMRTGDRTDAQYEESMRNLRLLIDGEPLEPAAIAALESRKQKRAEAEALIGRFDVSGGLAYLHHHDGEIDGAFFSARFERALVIMIAVPDTRTPERWIVKLRRSAAAPRGFSIHELDVGGWDVNYGGRANAGSNKRGGGTTMNPEEYAERLRERLRAHEASSPHRDSP